MTQTEKPVESRPTRLPGDGDMWVMVLGDMVIFAGYFVVFMIYRAMNREEFLAASEHLNVTIGVVNTVVLLTSSWYVVQAVTMTREGSHARAIRMLYAGALGGAVFVTLKGYEWFVKLDAGRTNSELFYAFYYVVTGVHLLHVVIGVIVLGVLVRELRNPGRRRVTVVESGGLYWHMVDMLWVIIFALFYVMR